MTGDVDAETANNRVYVVVGQQVREARTKAKITQSEIARLVGLTRSSMANLEAGRQRVPLHTLVRIAEILKVPAGNLLPRTPIFSQVVVVPDIADTLATVSEEGMRRFVESTITKMATPKKGA